ncbi:PASTA domain-containing protein [Terriglobus albidus]|uniref:PASTA domain-containing protein n=1 Tax=Terriglobus albidus TaxID=1592106 RepID=A0A5B9E731_9BACT|nr:penicillin-binding protein [Terriglobus albidus]QEE28092.1 PASTA domain-containing protein [Terriglobus albidus]
MHTVAPPRQTLTAPIKRVRFVYVAAFFLFWTVVISGRLAWLQIIRHSHYVEKAASQQERSVTVAPRRGLLYDRNLRELAMTVSVDSIYAVPKELGSNAGDAASLLAHVVHDDPEDRFTSEQSILARFTASHNFAWVAHRVTPEIAERVKDLNLKGVYFQKEFKRFYPNNDLASQVLGYVGAEDIGLGGLEREFEEDMHGTPGKVRTALDARRKVLGSIEQEPLPGENLVLSIDANIQHIAERALDEQVEKTKALHGVVVVQDPRSGQILALAVAPRFNPNETRHLDPKALSNLAVSDVYEPGSTFKLVTYASALDGANVKPEDLVDCQGGAITIFGRTIHDDISDRGMGVVTVQRALEKSSDVAAVKLAMKLGNERFYKYMRDFGFGDRSGIELPSETRGLLRPVRKWDPASIGSLAIGQEVGVTPIQLVTMVSTIANGGMYLPPHIILSETEKMKGDAELKATPFRPQNELPKNLPDGSHRVISELTAAKMRSMMQAVVVSGTGGSAALNGYSSGGKTGTAQKIDTATHTYSKTKHVASFAGIAPVSTPAIAVAVVIDTPTAGPSYYGGSVSAPVFAEVAQQVLEYLGIPHDQPFNPKKRVEQMNVAKVEHDDHPEDSNADLNAMFAEANALPDDDPLKGTANAGPAKPEPEPVALQPAKKSVLNLLPEKVLAAFRANGGANTMADAADNKPLTAPKVAPLSQRKEDGGVIVDATKRVAVPAFNGAALRQVVQQANSVGLRVQPVGSGLAREQVPSAGTMVPVGTQVVVRFLR